MTLPLGRGDVLKRYAEKHDYYDPDLVQKAYGRMFEDWMDIVYPPFEIDYFAEKPTMKFPPPKEKLTKEQEERYRKMTFADRIDEKIEEIKKEGLKRYNYVCEKCWKMKSILATDKEITEKKTFNITASADCKGYGKIGDEVKCDNVWHSYGGKNEPCDGTLKLMEKEVADERLNAK